MWVATADPRRSAAHPFYMRLNQILDQHDFDRFVEDLCQRFYADDGRPGLPPGRYFRLLLIGYFEGLDAERAIAWRAADSFALREFLGLVLPDAPPDHSTISRTRRLIDLETHEAVFTWMLQRLADAGLVNGKTVGIDATTLEANAALRSIVRRDTGESYQDFLTKLAQASGIKTPTRADLARLDRKRKKKGSNDDWTHPHDPDAKITKMKDGRTVRRQQRSRRKHISIEVLSYRSGPLRCAVHDRCASGPRNLANRLRFVIFRRTAPRPNGCHMHSRRIVGSEQSNSTAPSSTLRSPIDGVTSDRSDDAAPAVCFIDDPVLLEACRIAKEE
jgi:transposase